MIAIFEHNGFTRMEDVPSDPPRLYALPITKPLNFYAVPDTTFDSAVEIWNFELNGIDYVDGEQVAIYKYRDKQ